MVLFLSFVGMINLVARKETVWYDSEFFSHCIKGMILCPDTQLDACISGSTAVAVNNALDTHGLGDGVLLYKIDILFSNVTMFSAYYR
jgi:hypothetical protein